MSRFQKGFQQGTGWNASIHAAFQGIRL